MRKKPKLKYSSMAAWQAYFDCITKERCWRCKRKKGHTKKCLARQRKAAKARTLAELKEKRRKAKKITMTVGEFEEKLDEVRYDREDY